MTRRFQLGAAGAVTMVAMVFTGCARTDEAADTTAVDTGAAAIAPAPAPTTDTGAPATSATRRTVHVELSEWRVSPSESSFPAGPVQFHVMNQGKNVHALEVERGGQEWETARIQPSGTATIDLDATAGTYTLYCPVEDTHGNHRQRGMTVTVTVR